MEPEHPPALSYTTPAEDLAARGLISSSGTETPESSPPENPKLAEAVKRIKLAGHLGLTVAVITAVTVIVAMNGLLGDEWQSLATPLAFFDVAFIAGLSFGLLHKSRTAACSLLVFYVGSNIVFYLDTGKATGVLFATIVAIYLARGTIATFVYHRLHPGKRPMADSLRWVLASAGAGVVLVLMAIISLLIGLELGYLPDTAVVSGSEMSDFALEKLRTYQVLGDDESVVYFYSSGFLSFLADGNFFTDLRVVSYADLDGDPYFESALFEEIDEIEVAFSTSFAEDSIVTIHTDDGRSFILLLSPEDKKDRLFYDSLVESWTEKRPALPEPLETSLI